MKKKSPADYTDAEGIDRIEFHRHGFALVPDTMSPEGPVAVWIGAIGRSPEQRFCSCTRARKTTCAHLKTLVRLVRVVSGGSKNPSATADRFKASFWHDLAVVMADGWRQPPSSVQFMTSGDETAAQGPLSVVSADGKRLLSYVSGGGDRYRLVERCRYSASGEVPTRADILNRLSLSTLTEDERFLVAKGIKTVRRSLEETFWYRFAYHGFKEFGIDGCRIHPEIDLASGRFTLIGKTHDQEPLFILTVPREKVRRALAAIGPVLAAESALKIVHGSLRAFGKVIRDDGGDVTIQPMLRWTPRSGEVCVYRREVLERFDYDRLVFLPDIQSLAEIDAGNRPFADAAPGSCVISQENIPEFLLQHQNDLDQGRVQLDPSVGVFEIMSRVETVEISQATIDRDWCWLSITYGDGSQSVSLAQILEARAEGRRFIATPRGWIDCQARVFESMAEIGTRHDGLSRTDEHARIRLSRAELFRLTAVVSKETRVTGEDPMSEALRGLLALSPPTPVPDFSEMTTPLRDYQRRGVEWLWFLSENRLGGLLCDDMGLGKTHQAMAFMLALKASGQGTGPMLVVCPTTVISHWARKIADHAPGLNAEVYHGGGRDLAQSLAAADVLITSYGILRRDIDDLGKISLRLAVFDEIQHIKNAATQAWGAARVLEAKMKVGLTGTPIENSVSDLKALFDLVLPGYLGDDEGFERRFRIPIEENREPAARRELNRMITPFTLRRLKTAVLSELPEKIEDTRTCRLSDDQVKLYREAVASQGKGLVAALADEATPVPYMHVFALLNLLKQICNHPALALKAADHPERYASGKWDLFTELLAEGLDSGQKIVVYSQYLDMIRIITAHLDDLNVDFVSLTGASRDRGEIIARFHNNASCRVIVCSLKAGGVGIDLVAASMVIHYDRWWNAAREDQATDRVHRIGQRRGVQVFKLVTEGTLEEKIAAIIDKKRDLMAAVVKEDDPDVVKRFTRQELLGMFTAPGDAPR